MIATPSARLSRCRLLAIPVSFLDEWESSVALDELARRHGTARTTITAWARRLDLPPRHLAQGTAAETP